jgi:hypothetical protein
MVKCLFCENEAIMKNNQGFSVCKKCVSKNLEKQCPLCKSIMYVHSGKFGNYLQCFCGYRMSQNRIKNFNY